MIVKETARSTYLDVARIAWEPTRFPGVDVKPLYQDASGRQTSLVRMAPGARLPRHRHVGIEQSYMGEGNRLSRRWRGMRWSGVLGRTVVEESSWMISRHSSTHSSQM